MTMANALGLGVQKSRGGAGAAPPTGATDATWGALATGEVPSAVLPGGPEDVSGAYNFTATVTLTDAKPLYSILFPIGRRPTHAYWRVPSTQQDRDILFTFDTQTLNIGGAVYTLYTHPNPGGARGPLPLRWVG